MTGLKVVSPGHGATLQDGGRQGYGRFGVPEAGAMDRRALALANRLVGNAADEAAVEFALRGGAFEASGGGCRVAVAGAFELRIDGVAHPPYCAIDLPPGGCLAVGRAAAGVYGYLAVAGGFDAPPVLGSRSAHVRSGIGGGVLQAGTILPLRRADAGSGPCLMLDASGWPRFDGPVRIVWGPQDDHFTARGRAALVDGAYRVTAQSDRMGYRLEGPAIEHAAGYNIVSDGIALGSIQVPGTGQPIVLLADRQSTGGYPKIATIVSADIGRFVQRPPGTVVHFEAVPLEEADRLLREDRDRWARLFDSLHATAPRNLFDTERLLGLNLIDGFIAGVA